MGKSPELDDALKLLTIKHEMAHALGFDTETFALMRERDRKTRLPRGKAVKYRPSPMPSTSDTSQTRCQNSESF